MGRQAVPEVGALDQGVSLVGDQSPERDGEGVTSLHPRGVSSGEVGYSPCLQRQAEAVGLPIGQADNRDSLLGQHGLRHGDVGACTQNAKTFTHQLFWEITEQEASSIIQHNKSTGNTTQLLLFQLQNFSDICYVISFARTEHINKFKNLFSFVSDRKKMSNII